MPLIRVAGLIEGRQEWEEVLSMIDSLFPTDKDKREGFFRAMQQYAHWQRTDTDKQDDPLLPMSDAEAREFEKQRNPIPGKHEAWLVQNVPLGYLDAVADDRYSSFREQLRRYLRNDTIRRERAKDSNTEGHYGPF